MLQEGADVILPVGGPIGRARSRPSRSSGAEAVGLGVDVDWTLTVPDYTPDADQHHQAIDNSVFQAVERGLATSRRRPSFVSTLENEGVGLAPFHDYEDEISQEVKDAIEEMQRGDHRRRPVPSDYYGDVGRSSA